MNISLEVRVLRHALCLGQNGFMTAGLNDSALMKGQSAKGTGPEAAPIGYQTEFHFPDCGNAAGFAVAGVRIPAVGQVIDGVHFRLAQGLLRRILHHELPGAVGARPAAWQCRGPCSGTAFESSRHTAGAGFGLLQRRVKSQWADCRPGPDTGIRCRRCKSYPETARPLFRPSATSRMLRSPMP